jgi:hypothetical protein
MRPRVTAAPDRRRFRMQRATGLSAPAQHVTGVAAPGSEGVESLQTPYFRRKLRVLEEASEREILDSDLLSLERSVVVLGEPGMGKSELIGELGRAGGVAPVSAPRFMLSKNPGTYVTSGRPLLIDGLDEAIARDEKDAVDRVLAQLEDAGCPRFVLSCRSREWQSRSLRSLKEIYGAEPLVVSIEEFTRKEASAFWSSRGFSSAVEPVLDGLDTQGLSDLYKNPLTLSLLGRVADSGKPLPATRAELFAHVCDLIWREENDARQNTQLAQINQEQALSSAGACMAAMVFGGVDAIRLGGIAERQEGEAWLGDLENLPGAADTRALVASKLFKTVGVGRAAPIHRVIAEFLGARWLAAQATNSRSRRRLLAQFHGGGAVPSSLRGLHAWLAFHSPLLSARVIAADPFGLLRYGETALLDGAQAASLLDALERLAHADPYFRAQDWDARSAKGLAQPSLAHRIDAILADASSNFHLRTLLLEAIKDTPLAVSLSATLEKIVLDDTRNYAEREEALEAVFPHRGRSFWQLAAQNLVDQASENSARLARRLIEILGYDVADDLLASTLLAEIGLQVSQFPRGSERQPIRFRRFETLASELTPSRSKTLLRIISSRVPPRAIEDHDSGRDLSEILALLLLRALRGGAIELRDAPSVWAWLGQINERSSADKETLEQIRDAFDGRDKLRRRIQRYGMWTALKSKTLWQADHRMHTRAIGLAGNAEDVAYFLREVAAKRSRSRRARSDWSDLVSLGVRTGKDNWEVLAAARVFPGFGLKERAAIRRAAHPSKPPWRIHQEAEEAARRERDHANHQQAIAHFTAIVPKIRAADLVGTLDPAKFYLGLQISARNQEKMPPEQRLAAVYNEQLVQEFSVGFEATLHRSDLPTTQQIADSHAQGKIWHLAYPMVAGLLQRHRSGEGFAGVAPHTLKTGLLICAQQRGLSRDEEDNAHLRVALEQAAAPQLADKRAMLRYWIEPYLKARFSPHHELIAIEHIPLWNEALATLAREWLLGYPDMPVEAEMDLVNALVRAGDSNAILEVAKARDSGTYRDDDHALAWLAVDVAYRFDEVRPNLTDVGCEHPEFLWLLRDRLQSKRRGHAVGAGLEIFEWIISEFRSAFPHTSISGPAGGDKNAFDATDFLVGLASSLAGSTSDQASALMAKLVAMPSDTYTAQLQHLAAEQAQKRAEESFAPLPPAALAAILTSGAPSNIDDLRSVVGEELAEAQKVLLGDDLDQVRDFWTDQNIPRDENRCRDRLAALIQGPLFDSYGVSRMTEADMPQSKRADLAFAHGTKQLPMEVKGQWHPDVWDAANSQLASQYLIDWRSEGRGIYCVLWFGDVPFATGRRLKPPPAGMASPSSAEQMRQKIIALIPDARRPFIDVYVLDLSTGKK